MALDSIAYTGEDSLAVERLTKLQLFRGVEADSILQLDSILVAFADTFALTDLGKLYIAARQIKLNMAKSNAGKLAANVSTVTPLDTIASLWKEVLSMAYGKWADDDSTTVLSAADSSRLWLIGALCPYVDGPAVYTARTMLFSLDSAYFSLGNDCEFPTYNDPSGKRDGGEQEENDASDEGEFAVTIYPNPSMNGYVSVDIVGEEGLYEIEIYSIEGRSVLQQQFASNKYTLDVSGLNSGMYFVCVSSSIERCAWNGKLVLTAK